MLAPAFSFAEDPPVESTTVLPEPSPNRYMVGVHSVDFNYQEPGLMSDQGRLNGIALGFQRTFNTDRYFKITADYAQGDTLYNGSLQTNFGVTTPYSSTERFRVFNMEFLLGREPTDGSWPISTGIGYRNTYDNKTGQYDYRRDITYYYLIIGLNSPIYKNNNLKSILNLELSSLLGGGAKTYLSDVSTSYKDVNFEFQYGSALKAGLESYVTIFGDQQFLVDVSYKYWTLTDSKVEYIGNSSYGVEPHNTTGLFSITVGYVF